MTGALLASATSCLDAGSAAPSIAVLLYWDELPDSDGFRSGTCGEAGVDHMEWRLVRTRDGVAVAEGVDACCTRERVCETSIDSVVVDQPAPGDYALEITGFDANGAPRWGKRCEGLHVTRFDQAYRCDVPGPTTLALAAD